MIGLVFVLGILKTKKRLKTTKTIHLLEMHEVASHKTSEASLGYPKRWWRCLLSDSSPTK